MSTVSPANGGAGGGVTSLGGSSGLAPSADCKLPSIRPQCKDGFCRVPAGCFVMGSPRDEYAAGRDDDAQVEVSLSRPFEIGPFEVTNQQWQAEGFAAPLREVDTGVCRDAQCPISNINLFEAITFANRYSEHRGLPARGSRSRRD